jgi:hypothetical protein
MSMFGRDRSPGIERLRDLHVALDHVVAEAYGWGDLPLVHGYHPTTQGSRFTISEAAQAEVLDRLLKLNHARYTAKVARGLHGKRDAARKGRGKRRVGGESQHKSIGHRDGSRSQPTKRCTRNRDWYH